MTWNWKDAFDWRSAGPTKERLAIGGGLLTVVAAVITASGAWREPPAAGAARAPGGMAMAAIVKPAAWTGPPRPALEHRRGRAYAYVVPRGWTVNETSNGIDIAAPDGVTGVVASIAIGGFGQPSPEQYLRQVLAMTGQGGARIVSSRPIPPQPGPMGLQWRGIEAEIESAQGGRETHIRATSQILQGAGQYAAIVTGAQGPRESWDQLKDWLPRVRDAIRVTDGSIPTGGMAGALPRGIRHDDIYGRYNGGWHARQVPGDEISRAQREGMMGYKRLVDDTTGRIWELPLEAYDPTAGGWRDPMKPDLLLKPTAD